MSLCYHGFSETPGDAQSCEVCVEIRDLKKKVDEYRGMLWVLSRRDGLSLHIPKADLETIPQGAELLVWYEKLFDSMILKGICSPTGQGDPVKRLAEAKAQSRPKVVTLCGSTRFTSEMLKEAWRLTITGIIVIHWNILESKEAFSHGAEAAGGNVKEIVDALYLHKVEMADEVRVINVGGYIGDSTRTELRHAEKLEKPITWLEPDKADKEFAGNSNEENTIKCPHCSEPFDIRGGHRCADKRNHEVGLGQAGGPHMSCSCTWDAGKIVRAGVDCEVHKRNDQPAERCTCTPGGGAMCGFCVRQELNRE